MEMTDIIIKGNDLTLGQGRRTYQVWLGSELLLERSQDPEHDACRILSARDITGKLRTRWDGSDHYSMIMGIVRGAGRSVSDGNSGLKEGKFRLYSDARTA